MIAIYNLQFAICNSFVHRAAILVAACGLLAGCAPYRFGAASLYPADVATVHVPMFESDSFRRNLGERLTEAVCKRIEDHTPYKLVSSASADSVLTGRILEDRKRVLVESTNDDVRELEASIVVQVTWTRRDGTILAQQVVPLDAMNVDLLGTSPVLPEVGQSIATGHQKGIERLAYQIVGLMETPW